MKQLTDNVQSGEHNGVHAGRIDFFPKVPDYVDHVVLSTVNATWAKPAGARWAVFSSTSECNFAVKANGAATFPAGAVTDGSGAFLNPTQFDVGDIATLGIIADGTGVLTIACYA